LHLRQLLLLQALQLLVALMAQSHDNHLRSDACRD
jgi:hypothetical protein